jgi:phage gp36-like protein
MSYSTIDDIRASLPEDELMRLTDDECLGVVGEARVDDAIARAGADIDASCGGRYRVPVSPVPALLKKISVDIAIYDLYSRTVAEVPDARAEQYRNAMRQLEGISRGHVSLGAPVEPMAADMDSGARSNTETDGNVFSRGSMKGY